MPASRAIAPTVAGLSPETTFSADLLRGEERDRLAAFGAQPLGEDDDPERAQRLGQRRVGRGGGQRRVGGGEREHAAAGGAPPSAARSRSARRRRRRAAPRARRARAARRPSSSALQRRREENGTWRGRLERGVAVAEPARRGPPPGSRCATARSRRSGRARAPARRSSTPSAGTSSTTRSDASVSVPVLSVHITETDASDSIALSCWARMPRRAIFAAETAAVSETSRISPSGTMFTIAAVSVSTASAWLTSRIASETRARRRAAPSPPTRMISSRSIAFSSGERGWRNARAVAASRAARLSAPTAVASKAPVALDRERAGEDLLAGLAQHRLGLAGQVRLVERQPVAAQQRAVGDDLVAARRRARGRRRRPPRSATSRGSPSRTTVAVGATSAASLSSARFARTSWKVPIAMLATRMPRKSASLGCRRRSSRRRRPRGSG